MKKFYSFFTFLLCLIVLQVSLFANNCFEVALLHNLNRSDSEGICAELQIPRPKQIASALSARATNLQDGQIHLKMSDLNYATRPFEISFFETLKQAVYKSTFENKQSLLSLINTLEKNGYVTESGTDDFGAKFAIIQSLVENILSDEFTCGEIYGLVGMIHSELPFNPDCKHPTSWPLIPSYDDILKVFNAPSIERYLTSEGTLYTVYPSGKSQTLPSYPNLLPWPLETKTINPDMIGSTYFFRTKECGQYVFSVKAMQGQERAEWSLFFGNINSPIILERITPLFCYLSNSGGPTLACFGVGRFAKWPLP